MPDKPWPEWLPFSPEAAYEKGCEDGYSRGVTDATRHAAKQERILQELIAELRDEHRNEGYCGAALAAADRAEARLHTARHADTHH